MNGNDLDRKIDWFEIKRKIFHILLGLAIIGLIYLDLLKLWMAISILIVGIFLSLLYKKIDVALIHWFLQKFERNEHIKTFPGRGVIFLFLSIVILMLFFEKNIILASIMIWTFGDSVSAIVGKHYGTRKHPLNDNRIIEGTLAGIVAATIAASVFVTFYTALIASMISMIIESVELKVIEHPIDDNLLVPLISAIVLSLI